MIARYQLLRYQLQAQGYSKAFDTLENQNPDCEAEKIILTNYYCYLSIQTGYKLQQCQKLLKSTLEQPSCNGVARTFTLYHLAQLHFQRQYTQIGTECPNKENREKANLDSDKNSTCYKICQQIITNNLGNYYALQSQLDRKKQQENQYVSLEYILYYCFLMIAYITQKQKKFHESQNYVKISKKFLKERQERAAIRTTELPSGKEGLSMRGSWAQFSNY